MLWMLWFPRSIWILAACVTVWPGRQQVAALPHATYSHAGICPNDMNPNLWVDAMSTCTRECQSDKVSSVKFIHCNDVQLLLVRFDRAIIALCICWMFFPYKTAISA